MAEQDPTAEKWLPVVDYEALYEVSDFGRIRSLDRIKSNGRRLAGKILRTPLSEGYPCCNLVRDGKQILNRVHRLIAQAFIGPAPSPKHTVNHKDFDRTNNRAENLEWLSHADNMRHAHAAHRCAGNRVYARGDDYKRLSAETVRLIRDEHASGDTIGKISSVHGISRPHVSRIVSRKVWKEIY